LKFKRSDFRFSVQLRHLSKITLHQTTSSHYWNL